MDLHNSCASDNAGQKDVNAICMFLQDLAARENLSGNSSCVKVAPGHQLALRELPEILRKKDVEINNLSKCNTELSETVVCLRQEIYALRKEKLNSEREWKESRTKLLMVSERNAALVQELSKLNLENQKLKMEMLALTKEKCKPALYSPDMPFNTYPWLFPTERSIPPFLSSPIYQTNNSLIKTCRENRNDEIESCEEVSQKLFAQMKLEMKREMEELDKQHCLENLFDNEDICESCIADSAENLPDSDTSTGIIFTEDEFQKMEAITTHLEHDLVVVRLDALEQNRLIREMLQKVLNITKIGSSDSSPVGLHSNERIGLSSVPLNEYNEEATDSRFQFPRPSDESFRAYFTQQLSGSQQPPPSGTQKSVSEERVRTMQMVSADNISKSTINSHRGKTGVEVFNLVTGSGESENRSLQETTSENAINVNTNTAVKSLAPACPVSSSNKISRKLEDNSKICPMCQVVFPKSTTQEEFEAHVFNHFEAENSILENFEVIQY